VGGVDGTEEVESSRGPRGCDPGDCHCGLTVSILVRGLVESMCCRPHGG
jgi:hypothetical protein